MRVIFWPLRLPHLAAALDRWIGDTPRGARLWLWGHLRRHGVVRYEVTRHG